ncbi:sugar ABC transporter substrate-binding protein [Streptomyces spiroverticillatus]|uniref:Sugar ABC transporter substrate-binding protein n=1 Tax=Streptomyces finlayi TaxID=67296 RepID=A0A918X1Z3_9ACTN|nr:extracellular solute-binding protein [Streptomyces finlayi]GHA23061.1 sugar ABC transporter substrate-binding protein [Streptomyces spiroverticillatus]GHD04712.1 sugar ABC transporter substrate-binding protein [Streptomyces finlayi]
MTTTRRSRRIAAAAAAVCALALTATACGSSDTSTGASPGDVKSALEKGGTVKVWAWEPTLKKAAADFRKKYPKVKIELVNAGTGDKQYTALQNAASAGSGGPDVAQIEYYALGQFTIGKTVTDLAPYGASQHDKAFTKGPWTAVAKDKSVFAMPMDSGPMALFYNKRVFDKHKIAIPTTWDEYVEAARTLHKADPKLFITNDTGDAGATTSLIWQAGGRPYKTENTDVKIGFEQDAGTKKYTATWQKLLDEKLVAPITSWSDEWYKGLSDGSIATLAIGAWMPANFTTGAASAAGDWRAAPLPQWTKGSKDSAENGGSSLAVPKDAKNKELAYAFIEYATTGAGASARVAEGAFPATTADLDSAKFQETKFPYFGGQQANKIFAESARNVGTGWSYLPYQAYANSVFNDTVGKAYVTATPLAQGLAAWQQASVKYGNEQGFSVNK